jgi:hypothetical protein
VAADPGIAECGRRDPYVPAQELVQAEIAEACEVSQPTISRAISAITPLLVKALSDFVPLADELGDGTYYIVDGTLLPCWTRRAHPELKSGKHKASGLKVILGLRT